METALGVRWVAIVTGIFFIILGLVFLSNKPSIKEIQETEIKNYEKIKDSDVKTRELCLADCENTSKCVAYFSNNNCVLYKQKTNWSGWIIIIIGIVLIFAAGVYTLWKIDWNNY